MPGKKKNISLKKKLRLIKNAGIKKNPDKKVNIEQIGDLDKRIQKILDITNEKNKNKLKMLFFVMYDIENNKVRTEIAKFLERNGCVRVQKSIFFASAERKKYKELHTSLRDVQQAYQNNDSIFFVPVSTDEVKSMKMIGKNIDFDIVTGKTNTLFF